MKQHVFQKNIKYRSGFVSAGNKTMKIPIALLPSLSHYAAMQQGRLPAGTDGCCELRHRRISYRDGQSFNTFLFSVALTPRVGAGVIRTTLQRIFNA